VHETLRIARFNRRAARAIILEAGVERRQAMDEEDRALFRHAMRGVRRLQLEGPTRTGARRPPPRARFARAERLAVLQESLGQQSPLAPVEESGDALLFRRPQVGIAAFRRLRAGHYRVDGEIDLHGLTAAMVEPALQQFLGEAMRHRARVVRVIHGKGLRSGNRGPVLKLMASHYLCRIDVVLAFASAREVDGGSGAILVLLRPVQRALRPSINVSGRSP
jgi:DNA-nicking Smr family endonuclease